MNHLRILAGCWCALVLAGALPVPVVQAAADIDEQVIPVPVRIRDATGAALTQDIIVTVYEERGRASYPLLVLSHGRPATADHAVFCITGIFAMGAAGSGFSDAAGFSRVTPAGNPATVWAAAVSPLAAMR